ncbi:MAG: PLxRFG domain-containing protein [Verrucomicrobiales bacterium]|nr:PLxRFG domain-containing protein [Verrucomicrobiales bacterium]
MDVAAVEERRQATQAAAPTGREEDNLLIYTEAAAKPKSPVGKYFATQKDFQGGIDALAQDLVSTDQKKIPKAAKSASDWIRKNLSAAANKDLSRAIVELKTSLNDLDGLPLPVEAIAATSQPLPQQIRDNLSAGNLRAAINNLAQSADQTVSRVATAIEKGLGNTKVVMASGVVNAEGKTVAGLYDPKTDTITLNQDIPLKNHVLLHESMHAVTSHEIAKNTPAAQQMRKLFESVKDRLDTAYGSTNLDEFVAEAFSNPEFQAKLGRFTDKGEKISLWSKFKNIVNNMIRRYRGQPSKTVKSAMDKADMLVEDLISPAPESRDAAKLYSATVEETEKATLNSLGRFAKGKLREEDIATVSGYYAAASTATKNAMTQILPLNAVYKIAQNKYPLIADQAKKLFELLQTKNGDRQAYLKKIRDTAAVVEERIGKDKNVKETLDDWVAQSTIERTDPTKPRTDYLGDAARLEAWDLMNSLLDERNLTTTQRENLIYGYKMLRDSYSTVYKDLIKTMDTRLSAIEDEGVQQSLRDRLLTQLLQNETIEPYFPLYRKGSHWLFYRALDPLTKRVETYKESFESRGARNKARNLLEGTKGVTDIEVYERGKDKRFGQVDSQFAFDLLGKARKQGMSAELEATLLDALFDIMPERSLIRSFKQRENTLGFQRDALKVFRERAPNFTNQIINLKHDLALNKISTDLDEATLKYRGVDNADFEAAQNLNNTFQGYISFARNPNISSLSKMAKTLGFGWTLGFNISSVLVNASNLPIVVLPYLGGRYGFVDTMKTMNDARKLFMGTGMNRRTETLTGEGQTEVFEGPSLSNIDFSDPNLTPEQRELEELATLMEDRGQSNISTTGENLDMENPANTAWTFANNTMGWMFHQGERANRQITAITSYKLELAKRAKKGELTEQDRKEAAEIALDDTELTNSGAMIETAPRVSQNNWGNWMTMYKRFGISMYYLQFQMAKQALSRAKTPEQRAEAKRQIVGLFASSALFAGVQGLPLYGIVSWLGNNVFLDDEDEDFDSIAASYFGEGMYSGALNAIFQVDVGPRIGMSNLIYRSQPNRAEQDILLDIAEFVGGPVLGVGRRVIRGGNLIAEGEVWKGSEAVLPSVLSNGLKALRYATEGATTLRNDPIMEDVNAWNVFAQSLGLAPAGYTKQLEINARDKGVDRRVNAKRTKLMGDYYLAAKEGDVDGAAELVQEMIEFSERNPYAAISGDSLERSMRQHSVTDEIARQLGGIPASQRAAERILIRRMQDMGEE